MIKQGLPLSPPVKSKTYDGRSSACPPCEPVLLIRRLARPLGNRTRVPYELGCLCGGVLGSPPLDVGQPYGPALYGLAVPSRCASRSAVTRIAPVGDLIRDPPGG